MSRVARPNLLRGRLRRWSLLLLGVLCASAQALEIRETRWGFDGRVLPEHFNLLSILVDNPGPTPFDGDLVLEELRGMENAVGAPIVQPVYLAPHSSRFVQFHAYTTQESEWRLRWGQRRQHRHNLDAVKFGGPARVLLANPSSLERLQARLKTFPDDLFPTMPGATSALDSVVLAHAPRWETARREAFRDWIYLGGVVHLCRGTDGKYPEFSAELAALNGEGAEQRIGAGRVVRHEKGASEIDDSYLASRGFSSRELEKGKQVAIYQLDATVLRKLATLTRPQIVWWLIYLLTASYILVIGPGHYWWGRKRSYGVSIAAFIGVVTLYGAAFAHAGRRGANEQQSAHSLAIARPLGGKRYDVTQWISVFATRGAMYQLTHAAPANLYSTGADTEAVNGQITNGREGAFVADIPLFSSRPFIHRGVLVGDDTTVAVTEWQNGSDGGLNALALTPGSGFPKQVREVWVRQHPRFHQMILKAGRWELSGTSEDADVFLAATHFHQLNSNQFQNSSKNRTEELEAWLPAAMRMLIARSIGGTENMQHVIPPRPASANQLQLYIFAPAPATFAVQERSFKAQTGWVLYCEELFKP